MAYSVVKLLRLANELAPMLSCRFPPRFLGHYLSCLSYIDEVIIRNDERGISRWNREVAESLWGDTLANHSTDRRTSDVRYDKSPLLSCCSELEPRYLGEINTRIWKITWCHLQVLELWSTEKCRAWYWVKIAPIASNESILINT